jgi:hypothetical protein
LKVCCDITQAPSSKSGSQSPATKGKAKPVSKGIDFEIFASKLPEKDISKWWCSVNSILQISLSLNYLTQR